MKTWHPASWQTKPCSQTVLYPDTVGLASVLHHLASQPPLVSVTEVLALKKQLAKASLGQAFLLQGGDCAERFTHNNSHALNKQLALLQHLKTQLTQILEQPIICVGRIAGQYAKPRTHETETQLEVTLPSYRGDIINQHAFTAEARIPDPARIQQGYQCAAQTMSCIQKINPTIYTSHEALLLPYEQALTRSVTQGNWYNLSTHFPWCGMRTTQIDGAHIEYLRGIKNPIALKVGANITPDNLIQLLDILNPNNEPGRITLIHRLGANAIEKRLPSLIQTVTQHGRTVLWVCDPLHGNTQYTSHGAKTRSMCTILNELRSAFEIHAAENTYLGGVHLELTSDNVMECTNVSDNYASASEDKTSSVDTALVDPRLNQQQALKILENIANFAVKNRNALRQFFHTTLT